MVEAVSIFVASMAVVSFSLLVAQAGSMPDDWEETMTLAFASDREAHDCRYQGDFPGALACNKKSIRLANKALDLTKDPERCRITSTFLRLAISFSDGLRASQRG